MEKSIMMVGTLIVAMCVSSCISSLTMVSSISNSLDALKSEQESDTQEGTLQSAGTFREAAQRVCQECQAANWEGNIPNPLNTDSPSVVCTDIKQNCIDEILSA